MSKQVRRIYQKSSLVAEVTWNVKKYTRLFHLVVGFKNRRPRSDTASECERAFYWRIPSVPLTALHGIRTSREKYWGACNQTDETHAFTPQKTYRSGWMPGVRRCRLLGIVRRTRTWLCRYQETPSTLLLQYKKNEPRFPFFLALIVSWKFSQPNQCALKIFKIPYSTLKWNPVVLPNYS